MTQTPLQEEEAAGTLAAGADLSELDPTADVVRSDGEAEPAADLDAVEAKAGPVSLKARMVHTPKGLLAAGVLVSGILLSTAVLVWVATASARRHPVATA
ncbi:hypothetical protein GGQ87_001608 [Brevundimonas alba]|uniref:Uncharacterized protein n=1 Tax=Brevundimonas alba TaxID=74314 RepID=A0A7X5YMP0_9CAUL|nr:hypothetical protein [Brevundimonas alba]NJC41350.1 hypothetical protein [Brevundimonas alba]